MKRANPHKSAMKVDNSREGHSLEVQLRRMMNNGEMIKDEAPLLYTERKEGIMAAYNIRTDRFEVALDGVDKINKSYNARRDAKMEVIKKEKDGGTEPIQGTNNE